MFEPDIDLATLFDPEDLCEELAECEGDSSGGHFRGIWHPLVVSVPYFPQENRRLNMTLRMKREKAQGYWDAKQWGSYVAIHERPFRIDALERVVEAHGDPKVIWPLIADFWIDSENIWQCMNQWRRLWSFEGHDHRLIMDKQERRDLESMPDQIKVWRGTAFEESVKGMSWTIDRKKAIWFANRYPSGEGRVPRLVEGVVAWDDVLAYFKGRGEREIVAFPENVEIKSVRECAT